MTTTGKSYRTSSGRELSESDIEAIAKEVERKAYDVEDLKERRDVLSLGPAQVDVIPVRIEPDVREAIAARAEAEETTTTEIIRRALRSYLKVV